MAFSTPGPRASLFPLWCPPTTGTSSPFQMCRDHRGTHLGFGTLPKVRGCTAVYLLWSEPTKGLSLVLAAAAPAMTAKGRAIASYVTSLRITCLAEERHQSSGFALGLCKVCAQQSTAVLTVLPPWLPYPVLPLRAERAIAANLFAKLLLGLAQAIKSLRSSGFSTRFLHVMEHTAQHWRD